MRSRASGAGDEGASVMKSREQTADRRGAGAAPPAPSPLEGRSLRILLLEDVPTDAELVEMELRRAHLAFSTQRVETREEFLHMLDEFAPEVILADYSLPRFNALDALGLLRERRADIPFVLVTGTQTEEIAVRCMKEGADDYILKDSLKRLPAAVLNALQMREA